MPYELLATSRTPALIIFLLDVSLSMDEPLRNKRKIDVVTDALDSTIRSMVFLSTKGKTVSPRYKLAMYAYSDKVYDLLDGIKTITEVAHFGAPELSPMEGTDTAKAFLAAEKLLDQELKNLRGLPAPIVCHMTDGEYSDKDPDPIAKRIMKMSVPDGNVLVENIFLSEDILAEPVKDPYNWPGVTDATELQNEYAEKLRVMSSDLPGTYRTTMQESGYRLDEGAKMMLPGSSPDLVAMGFQMAMATPVRY